MEKALGAGRGNLHAVAKKQIVQLVTWEELATVIFFLAKRSTSVKTRRVTQSLKSGEIQIALWDRIYIMIAITTKKNRH